MLVDMSVAAACAGGLVSMATDLSTAGLLTASTIVASTDDGPIGDGVRALGNATASGITLAKKMDEEYDIGWYILGAFELAREGLPTLKKASDIVTGVPPPLTRRERIVKAVELKARRMRRVSMARMLRTRAAVHTATTTVARPVQHLVHEYRSLLLALLVGTPLAVLLGSFASAIGPSCLAGAAWAGELVADSLILAGAGTKLAAVWAGEMAIDVLIIAGAGAKLGVARLLLWITTPLVAVVA